jgi:hypothetical protein
MLVRDYALFVYTNVDVQHVNTYYWTNKKHFGFRTFIWSFQLS